MNRDFIIQIIKGSTTYSNDENYATAGTTVFGISAGTQKLDAVLCTDELQFGNCNSAKFEAQLFNLSVDVSGCRILVYCSENNGAYKVKFTGTIDSAKQDRTNFFRNIVAYDALYYVRDKDVASAWNNNGIWTDSTTYITLKTLRQRLCLAVGLTDTTTQTLVNDNVLFAPKFTQFSSASFGQILKMICEIQASFPIITGTGGLKFITLSTTPNVLDGLYDTTKSTFEDYETDAITAIGVYTDSNTLTQTVGDPNAGSTYSLVGNIFAISWDSAQITQYLGDVLYQIEDYTYTPAKIEMIIGSFDYELGDLIVITRDNMTYSHYVLGISWHNSLLIDETINCPAKNKRLSGSKSSYNNNLMTAQKITKIEQSINEIVIIAQSKNKTYYQNAVPTTGVSTGDLWYTTGETAPTGYIIGKWYRYNGSSWDLTEDSTIAEHTAELIIQSQEISSKVSETGGTQQSFGWSLTSSGFVLYSNSTTIMEVTASGATINGNLVISGGTKTIADIEDDAVDALTTVGDVTNNIYTPGTTEINGNRITTGSISASKISAGILESTNYTYTSGNYSDTGVGIDLDNNIIRTPYFYTGPSGAGFKGNLEASNTRFNQLSIHVDGTTSLDDWDTSMYMETRQSNKHFMIKTETGAIYSYIDLDADSIIVGAADGDLTLIGGRGVHVSGDLDATAITADTMSANDITTGTFESTGNSTVDGDLLVHGYITAINMPDPPTTETAGYFLYCHVDMPQSPDQEIQYYFYWKKDPNS